MVVAVKEKDENRDRLLRLLTYEVVDGRPIYYRGYRDVLEGKRQPEEVMGASFLQAFLVKKIALFLIERLEKGGEYEVLFHELGIKTGRGLRTLDLAVFRRRDLPKEPEPFYMEVPPDIVLEVDVRAEIEDAIEYILEKSGDLLAFGVRKVVWIFTKPRRVFVFEKGKKPVIYDWEDEIHLLEDVKLRLSDILKRP